MADDILNYTGLTTKTNNDLVNELKNDLQQIYSPNGENINFEAGSPDGNFVEILAEIGTLHRELITAVYNATNPTNCVGAEQDNKYLINYLTRKGGSYTTQNITIEANKTVTLQGLDGNYSDNTNSAFTVSDDSGNKYYLIDTTTIYAGLTSLPFRAEKIGEVIPIVGTITNINTVTNGIISVINDSGYTELGIEQESDLDFRIRRDRSVALASGNTGDSIQAQLLQLDNVNDCRVWINDTNTTDSTGTQAHYIWCIVDGGANTDIANIIYDNKGGCGTRGAVTIPLTTVSGQVLNIKFDRPTIKPLFIKFDVKEINDVVNVNGLKNYISNNLFYELGEPAETSKITSIIKEGLENQLVNAYGLNVLISSGGSGTASIGSSTGITGVTLDNGLFQTALGNITTGTYTFTNTSEGWQYNGHNISIGSYGLTVTGTAVVDDEIIVSWTAGAWVEYLATSTIADKFTTDNNKIYINILD